MSAMTATAADYTWFEDRFPDLAEAYCLTLVRGLTPEEFLARLGAQAEIAPRMLNEFYEPTFEVWEEHQGKVLFIGATSVPGEGGDWVLAVEVNGYLGVTEAAMVPLSAGTRVVSHYCNVNAVDRFYWIEDEDVRVSFEPLFAAHREGSTPDALVEVMRQVGFDLREDRDLELVTAAAFALAEHLTGVRVTPELLEESAFVCGTAPIPRE